MLEGKLVDLVPFEGDFATYLETWMNEEVWFRSMFWDQPVDEFEGIRRRHQRCLIGQLEMARDTGSYRGPHLAEDNFPFVVELARGVLPGQSLRVESDVRPERMAVRGEMQAPWIAVAEAGESSAQIERNGRRHAETHQGVAGAFLSLK